MSAVVKVLKVAGTAAAKLIIWLADKMKRRM